MRCANAPPRRAARSKLLGVLGAFWLASVMVGMGALVVYAKTPGAAAATPDDWPAATTLSRSRALPTLVMLVHPRCPCSRASLAELAAIMTRARGRVTAHVLFARPLGVEPDWAETDLWDRALAIPGVLVSTDDALGEAALFGAKTSGQVALYDAAGTLVFSGGITGARGHAGDNEGRAAVLALVDGDVLAPPRSSVFGCLLGEDEPADAEPAAR